MYKPCNGNSGKPSAGWTYLAWFYSDLRYTISGADDGTGSSVGSELDQHAQLLRCKTVDSIFPQGSSIIRRIPGAVTAVDQNDQP